MRCGARLGRFRADVDDVGALLFQFDGAREGAVRIEILSAVGKRIGRDVQHAHQERAFAEQQFAAGESSRRNGGAPLRHDPDRGVAVPLAYARGSVTIRIY